MPVKPVLIYLNHDSFSQVDDTVLHHLVNDFRVIWFYYYESRSSKSMRMNPKSAKEYADKYGFELEIVDPKVRRMDIRNLRFFNQLAKKINSYNPDIVFSCNNFPFWALCYHKLKCKNKVLGVHDVSMHSYKFSVANFIVGWSKKINMKRTQYIFTFSPNQHALLKQSYGKESKMVGMSYKDFGQSILTPGNIEEGVKLLFFGKIHPYKGLDLLITVIEKLRKSGVKNLYLTIAGNGPAWSDCKELIETEQIYNLQVRFINDSEIPDLMSSHHFLVLPYRNSTQSGPLVAALAYGLPVIAPNYGCFSDTYTKESAILYNEGKLENALLEASKLSAKQYSGMRQATETLKQSYSEETIAENYIKAFKQILQEQ